MTAHKPPSGLHCYAVICLPSSITLAAKLRRAESHIVRLKNG